MQKRYDSTLPTKVSAHAVPPTQYGLVGSTEWGEDFASWISENVVAYLNVDVSVAGSQWDVKGSPSLANLIHQTALDIPHPTKEGKTLWDARYDEGPFVVVDLDSRGRVPAINVNMTAEADAEFAVTYAAERKERLARKTGVSPLGSGSDYTVFLQRLGVG